MDNGCCKKEITINSNSARINQDITASEVLLISNEGHMYGVTDIEQALFIACEKELDLVEVAPNAKPPVCKIMDYSKYLYDMEKQERHQKAKSKSPELKEIRLSLKIGSHDLEVKAKKASTFLEKGSRVRIFMQLKGREMAFQDRVNPILDHFKQLTQSDYEQAPTRLGNRFSAIIKKG